MSVADHNICVAFAVDLLLDPVFFSLFLCVLRNQLFFFVTVWLLRPLFVYRVVFSTSAAQKTGERKAIKQCIVESAMRRQAILVRRGFLCRMHYSEGFEVRVLQKLESLDSSLSGLKTEVSALKTEVSALKTEVQAEISALRTEVSAVRTKINSFDDYRRLFYGGLVFFITASSTFSWVSYQGYHERITHREKVSSDLHNLEVKVTEAKATQGLEYALQTLT